ncbi:hypothetical protein OS493_011268 [Desmophyllum pertusum]|uniref:Uncharacterized protein n=1 Tax=Desmophyllum pertusum TaxID=174260 RepID=A0A9W9Z5D5_9CNID|nr:hypothetical protein OS493_011268 [Desmophyllum pertusum]
MEILRQVMKNAAANYSQRGIVPLEKLITQYGGWTVTGTGLNPWTVQEKMGYVLRDLNVQTLLSVSVATDPMDSSQHILRISYSSLGMGIKYYFDESNQGEQIRLAYKTYMKTVARLLGGGIGSDYKMMNIYNFESSIARGVQSKSVSDDMLESLRDIDGQRSGRSLDSVDKTIYDFCIDSKFDESVILYFLEIAFSKQKITFDGINKIYYPHSETYLTLFKTIAEQYKLTWAESPAEVNGYYSAQQNRIVFLAGILQSPFYRKMYPKYLNYGSLAMVIGHEITHGFDSQGRNFDKNGNFKDWWSTSSKNNFITRAYCLVQQYNGYEVFEKYINGIQTLNENIADNGGIKLAYDAYQSWVDDNKKRGAVT